MEEERKSVSSYAGYFEAEIDSCGIPIVLSNYPSSPDKPCVLFLPGTMVHPLFYDEFLARIAGSGFNVAGLHFISHGKSPRIKGDFTFGDMVQNVKDAISYCEANYSGDIILMGSSQGSIAAMAAAGNEKRIKALFVHDMILPELPETMSILNIPAWFRPFFKIIPFMMRIAARLFPTYQVALESYLDPDRVTLSSQIVEKYLNDPFTLKSYPLSFLASLFSVELKAATDGSLACPVVVIAAKDDPLFTYEYMKKVFAKIAAPKKEMLLFDLPYHILFVEAVDEVAGPIVEKLNSYSMKDK